MQRSVMNKGLLEDENDPYEKYTESHMLESTPLLALHSLDNFQLDQTKESEHIEISDNDSAGSDDDDMEMPTKESVEEKEKEVEEYRNEIKDMKQRFIWDLSLAIKRKLCTEIGMTSEEAVRIASVPITSIISSLEEEDPKPKTWINWITQKFTVAA